jgi:putative endonuclease
MIVIVKMINLQLLFLILKKAMAEHIEKGKKSEEEAADWLKDQGYEIVRTNFRFNKKEIDIIARKEDLLVFVEVKTKSFRSDESPGDIVTLKKQKFLFKAAEAYMIYNGIDMETRFDVIFVIYKHEEILIEHIKNAFSPLG